MKSYIIALMVAVAAVVCSSGEAEAAPKRLKGSGNIITKELPAPTHYRSVHASRGVKVQLVADTGQPMKIEADDNVMPHVITEVEGGVLGITIDEEVRTISSIHVVVTVPTKGQLRGMRVVSAAQIESKVTITGDEVGLDASSAGKIEASVSANECEISLSSAAKIVCEVAAKECSIEASSAATCDATLAVQACEVDASSAAKIALKGAAQKCEADLSSASHLRAKNLAVQHYDIEVSSAADATILCLKHLKASASSGGDIRYAGNCLVSSKRSSGGSIQSLSRP